MNSCSRGSAKDGETEPCFGLLIALCSIVGFAKHLAVIDGCCASSAPSCDMVCVHLFQFIYTSPIVVSSKSAQGAIRNAVFSCLFSLLIVNNFLS